MGCRCLAHTGPGCPISICLPDQVAHLSAAHVASFKLSTWWRESLGSPNLLRGGIWGTRLWSETGQNDYKVPSKNLGLGCLLPLMMNFSMPRKAARFGPSASLALCV